MLVLGQEGRFAPLAQFFYLESTVFVIKAIGRLMPLGLPGDKPPFCARRVLEQQPEQRTLWLPQQQPEQP
jgi:hypothetical protein